MYLSLPLLLALSAEPHPNYCLAHVSSGPIGAEGRPTEHPQTSEGGATALSHFNRPAVSR